MSTIKILLDSQSSGNLDQQVEQYTQLRDLLKDLEATEKSRLSTAKQASKLVGDSQKAEDQAAQSKLKNEQAIAQAAEKRRIAEEKAAEAERLSNGLIGKKAEELKNLRKAIQAASSTKELEGLNKALQQTQSEMRELSSLGTKSSNTFGSALGSFAFKFNFLGNLLSDLTLKGAALFGEFISGAQSAFVESAKATAKVEQAIASTAGAAGLAISTLVDEASRLQSETLFGDDQILNDSTAQLLTFTNIAGDNFLRAQKAALDLSTVLDGDLKGASIQLGKALNDPVAGLSALGRSGIQFSDQQKATIKSLADTNQLAAAQDLILKELERQYGGQAKAAKAAVGVQDDLRDAYEDAQEAVGEFIDNGLKLILPLIVPIVRGFGTFLAALKEVPTFIRENKVAILALGAAILGLKIPLITTTALQLKDIAVKRLQQLATIQTAIAQQGLNAALRANPIGLVITAIGLLVAAFATLYNKSETVRAGIAGLAETAREVYAIIRETLSGYVEGFNLITEGNVKDGLKKIGTSLIKSNPIGLALTEGKRLGEAFGRGYNNKLKEEGEKGAREQAALIAKNGAILANAQAKVQSVIAAQRAKIEALEKKKLELEGTREVATSRKEVDALNREITRVQTDLEKANKELDVLLNKSKDQKSEIKKLDAESDRIEFKRRADLEFKLFTLKKTLNAELAKASSIQDLGRIEKLKSEIESINKQLEAEPIKLKVATDLKPTASTTGTTTSFLDQIKDFAQEYEQELNDLASFITSELDKISERRIESIEKQQDAQEDSISTQRELAKRGLDNTLKFEEERAQKLEAMRAAEEERQRKRALRLAILQAVIGSLSGTGGQDQTGLSGLLGKVGAFRDGGIAGEPTMYREGFGGSLRNGVLHGRSHSSGGILIEAEGSEGILSSREMSVLGRSGFYALKDALASGLDLQEMLSSSNRQLSVVSRPKKKQNEMLLGINRLIKVIEDKPALESVHLDELNNLIATVQERGNKKKIKYMQPKTTGWR